jgi:hypothetical protein
MGDYRELLSPEPSRLLMMAGTAAMAAARTIGMATGTSFAAIIVTFFFKGFAGVNYTRAIVAGTFRLGSCCHGNLRKG